MKAPGPKRKGQHRYKGELAKKLLAGVVYLTDKMTAAELGACLQRAIYESRVEKLPLLAKHYGIEKTDYFRLALALAIDHVPGFRIGRASELLKLKHGDYGKVLGNKRGREREWTLERLYRLPGAVEAEKKKCSISTDDAALRVLARRPEWGPSVNYRGTPEKWLKTLKNKLAAGRHLNRLAGAGPRDRRRNPGN